MWPPHYHLRGVNIPLAETNELNRNNSDQEREATKAGKYQMNQIPSSHVITKALTNHQGSRGFIVLCMVRTPQKTCLILATACWWELC